LILGGDIVSDPQRPKRRCWMRLLYIVLMGAFVYFFWPMLLQVRRSLPVLLNADPLLLALAIVIEALSFIALAWLNLLSLRPFSESISLWRMLEVLLSAAFATVAVPSAGMSGIALRARYLMRDGYTVEASTFSYVLESFWLAVVLVALSILGLVHLVTLGQLSATKMIIFLCILVLLAAATVAFVLAGRDRRRAHRLVCLVARWVNRLRSRFHRRPVDEVALGARVDDFYRALSNLRRMSPLPFLSSALLRISLDVACLYFSFRAFGYSLSIGTLFTAFGLSIVLGILSFLPGGLGVTEASLTMIFATLGVPVPTALVAVLAYRLIAFWLPRLVGLFAWMRLERRGDQRE